MRVVGGAWRGRPLQAPAGRATRPTSDKVREAVFDVLGALPEAEAALAGLADSADSEAPGVAVAAGSPGGRVGGALAGHAVLDVFAGSGALGIEALSRGAATCTFVEAAAPALRALRGNLERLGVPVARAGGGSRSRSTTPPVLTPSCSGRTCGAPSRLTPVAARDILSCLRTRPTMRTSGSVPPS